MTGTSNTSHYDAENRHLTCADAWDLAKIPQLKSLLDKTRWPQDGQITMDGSAISKMDTAGAWLLNSLITKLKKGNITVSLTGFSEQHLSLIKLIEKHLRQEKAFTPPAVKSFLVRVGQTAVAQLRSFFEYLSFIGLLSLESLRLAAEPRRIRFGAVAGVVYRTGYAALPIIALLSFMIGVVITYQMGLQLKNYGANIFIVDLLGLAILREFGPLLTAIMIAGRTGSAYTAQLGLMKTNQEIDALDTMGITPSELLLLPRIVGLVIALPLLTIWADMIGVFGGMVMSNNMLSITWYDFLHRFPNVIPLRALLIGLGKAPIFALIISSVGCFQGVNVTGSADSVGNNTTRSVVMAIFFIIVADAIFSIIFSKLKL